MQSSGKPCVLIVDDEEMVLTSIRMLLRLETEHEVQGFRDPEEALRFLQTNLVDVLVADYLMPKMNGLEFLAKAKELHPEVTRILLTGHADKQSAIHAINAVGLFQYIEKPWDNAQLLLVINSGIERTSLLRTLQEKITQLDTADSKLKEVQSRLIKAFL